MNEQISNFNELIFMKSIETHRMLLNKDLSRFTNLQCKMEVWKEHLCFLDLKISIIDNKFVTIIFGKPTNSHL